jgi:hypothetical protein
MEKLGPEEASLESLIETELLKVQSLCYLRNLVRFLRLNLEGNSPPGQHQLAERLGCPVVSLRSDNGLVFGLFYDQAQPRPLLGTRSLSVRWSPSPRERMPAGRCRGGV